MEDVGLVPEHGVGINLHVASHLNSTNCLPLGDVADIWGCGAKTSHTFEMYEI